MKNTKFALASGLLVTAVASAGFGPPNQVDVFADSQNDLFDNGFANLDITRVVVSQWLVSSNVYVDVAVTTRGMSDWTKYMLFADVPAMGASYGSGSNPWNRPVNLNGRAVDLFVGGWIDNGGGNQMSMWIGTGWGGLGGGPMAIDWSANTVHFSLLPFAAGSFGGAAVLLDVATSGGGANDPGVDHLSRSDMATNGWGSPSVAGDFNSFTIIPAPGVLALLGMAGVLVSRRRRH